MAKEQCPDGELGRSFYVNGRVIYSNLLKQSKASGLAPADPIFLNYKDTMIWIYESKMEIEDDPEWKEDYANFLYDNKDERHQYTLDLFYDLQNYESPDAITIRNSLRSHIRYFESLEENKGIELYRLNRHLAALACKSRELYLKSPEKGYEKSIEFLNVRLSKIAPNCHQLDTIVDESLKHLEPSDWDSDYRQLIFRLYSQYGCSYSSVYEKLIFKTAEDTSVDGRKTLFQYYLSTGELDAAMELYEKVLEEENSEEDKSKWNYKIAKAQFDAGKYSSAMKYARLVQGEDKPMALKTMAMIIARKANSCGNSTFERKANNWLANDYINKAIDAGLKGTSRDTYLDRAPNKTDVFQSEYEIGDEILLDCWKEKTIIRISD